MQAQRSRSLSVLAAAAASVLDATVEQSAEAAATCDADASENQQRAAMLMMSNTSDGASANQVDENATADEVDLMQLILHDGPPQAAAAAEGRSGRPQQRRKRELPACLSS